MYTGKSVVDVDAVRDLDSFYLCHMSLTEGISSTDWTRPVCSEPFINTLGMERMVTRKGPNF